MAKYGPEVIIRITDNASSPLAKAHVEIDSSLVKLFKKQTDWLRTYLKTSDLEQDRILMAHVLTQITGDDLNLFAFNSAEFPTEVFSLMKQNVLNQMDIEIRIPETPYIIRRKLQHIRKRLKALDWTNNDEYLEAKSLWCTEIRDFTQREIDKTEKFDSAVTYKAHHQDRLDEAWNSHLASKT